MAYTKEQRQEYYRANKAKAIAYAKDRIEEKKAWLAEQKARPCTDCGIQYPPHVMQFDHVRGEKVAHVSQVTRFGWGSLREEVAKCEVVCANCHAERTHQRRK